MRVTKALVLFASARVHTIAIQNNDTPKKLRIKLRNKLRCILAYRALFEENVTGGNCMTSAHFKIVGFRNHRHDTGQG